MNNLILSTIVNIAFDYFYYLFLAQLLGRIYYYYKNIAYKASSYIRNILRIFATLLLQTY